MFSECYLLYNIYFNNKASGNSSCLADGLSGENYNELSNSCIRIIDFAV